MIGTVDGIGPPGPETRDRPPSGSRRLLAQEATSRALLSTAMVVLGLAVALPAVRPARADPPPWAPAYGYRAHHDKGHGKYKHREKHRRGYGPIIRGWRPGGGPGTCDREVVGTILGAVAGGLAGSRLGHGDDRTAATVAGIVVGALVGGALGRSMDRVDQTCLAGALEEADDSRSVAWKNPDTGTAYRVTPTRTYGDGSGRYCREFVTEATIGGRRQQVYGTACRQPDGTWERLN